MENNENEWYRSQDGDNKSNTPGHAQVPSSLLPTVLHRLGLTPEQASSELPARDWNEDWKRLKSENWEERAAAVRALGQQETSASMELLLPALQDEDASVRAATVHVLGNLGMRVPLHLFVLALSDADWHVRETAVFALGRQGPRVPREVIMTVLHDTDAVVRDAARIALQQHSAEESASVVYGALWEQKIMQNDDRTLANGKENHTSSRKVADEGWEGTFSKYTSTSSQPRVMREQIQEYAPQGYSAQEPVLQEAVSYEYEGPLSSHGEKVTNFPRRRSWPKGWWAALAIVALLFFVMGRMTIGVMSPPKPFSSGERPGMMTGKSVGDGFSFEKIITNPKYTILLQREISGALRLSPDAITMQLKAGKSLSEVAKAQGISEMQWQDTEVKAFTGVINDAVNSGDLDPGQADAMMQSFKENPQVLDKLTTAVFLSPSFNNSKP